METKQLFIKTVLLLQLYAAICFAASDTIRQNDSVGEAVKTEAKSQEQISFDPFSGNPPQKAKTKIYTIPDSNGIRREPAKKSRPSNDKSVDAEAKSNKKPKISSPKPDTSTAVEAKKQNIQINFPQDVSLETVIQYVSKRLNVNILYNETLKKERLTISSPSAINESQLFGLLKSILQFTGFTLVKLQDSNWYKVIEAKELTAYVRLLQTDPNALGQAEPVAVMSQVFPVRYIGTEKLQEAIKPFLSGPSGSIVSFPQAKLLIVTDYASNINMAQRILELIDVTDAECTWHIFEIKHVPVQKLVTDVKSIVSLVSGDKDTGDGSFANIIALPQINALAAAGRPTQIARINELITRLDVKDDLVTEFLSLDYISSQQAKQLLFAALGLQSERTEDKKLDIYADEEGNRLIVTCSKDDIKVIKDVLYNNIDIEPAGFSPKQAQIRIYKLNNIPAQQIELTLKSVFNKTKFLDQPIESVSEKEATEQPDKSIVHDSLALDTKDTGSKLSIFEPVEKNLANTGRISGDDSAVNTPTITIDKNTNSLIVVGTSQEHHMIDEIIKRLDRRRPQVLAEVMLVAINSSDSLELGVELENLEQDGRDYDSMLFTSFGLSNIDTTTGKRLIGGGSGFIGALIRPDEVPIILHALKSKTNAKVFAAPKLLVMDNGKATLSSVAETPFTSVNASQTVATTSFAGYAEAGTQLAISARIAESDYVELEYRVTSSVFTQQSSTADIPPPRNRDELHSSVCVPDGYTLVVGGLTRETLQDGINSVPLLGDLPLVGALFRNQKRSKIYSTLYVFIKPIILHDDNFADLKFLSDEEFKQVDWPEQWPSYEWIYVR